MKAPGTVAEVVARMHAIDAEVRAGDGPGVFNRIYLQVTETVRDRLSTGGVFVDDVFMADLDVRFAQLWFQAYDATDRVPRAWAPLFEARAHPGVLPIQFALAGMNAHIEHDLPLAVVATCAAHRRHPGSPGVRRTTRRSTIFSPASKPRSGGRSRTPWRGGSTTSWGPSRT